LSEEEGGKQRGKALRKFLKKEFFLIYRLHLRERF